MPGVSHVQWALSACSLLLATSGYLLPSHSALATLTLLLALLGVVLLVQTAFEAAGTRLPGKLFLVGSVVVYFWSGAADAARRDVPFSTTDSIPIHAPQFDAGLIQLALVYITLFQLCLLVGYSVRPRMRRLAREAAARVDSASHRARILRYGLAVCAVLPVLLSYDLDVGSAVEALMAGRRETGVEATDIGLLHFLLFFGMFGAALFMVEAVARHSPGKVRNLAVGAVTVLPFVMRGTRHLWLFISLSTFVLIFRRFAGRLTITRVLRWGAVVLLIVLVMQFQYAFRTAGWGEVEAVSAEDLSQVDVTGQFNALLFAEHLVPATHDYFMEPAETYFLIHWIPRKVWPDKPIMESWAFYNESYVRGGWYNVTPSVIGQFHLNWGVYGVIFIGVWLGLLASAADRLLLSVNVERQCAVVVVIGMFYAFIISSFRFYSPIYFAYFLFGLVAMLAVTRRSRAPRRDAFEAGPADARAARWLPARRPTL